MKFRQGKALSAPQYRRHCLTFPLAKIYTWESHRFLPSLSQGRWGKHLGLGMTGRAVGAGTEAAQKEQILSV